MQLSDSNIKLREELDQTRSTTRRLNEEVLRLSGELSATRQRLDAKEREWEERLKVHTYVCSAYLLRMYIEYVRTLHVHRLLYCIHTTLYMCVCMYIRTYVHMYARVPLWATLYIESLQISSSTTHCLHVH